MNKNLKTIIQIAAFIFILFVNPILFICLALFIILLDLDVFRNSDTTSEEVKPKTKLEIEKESEEFKKNIDEMSKYLDKILVEAKKMKKKEIKK